MSNVLHETPPRKLHQTLTMNYDISILLYIHDYGSMWDLKNVKNPFSVKKILNT